MKTFLLASVSVLLCSATFAATTPKEACDSLAKAAREDNFSAFKLLTVEGEGKEKGFHKMHKDKMVQLKDLNCGTETVAGTHAFVEATSEKEKRLVPFLDVGGTWKFDIATYKAFYRHPVKK